MKKLLLMAAGALALATSASAVDVEVVLSVSVSSGTPDWTNLTALNAAYPASFIVNPDAEAIATANGRVFLQNGSDTDDGDGSGIFSFDPSNPQVGAKFMILGTANSGNNGTTATPLNFENMLLNSASWSGISNGGENIRSIAADAAGNVYATFDDPEGQALIKIAASSDLSATASAEVLSTNVDGVTAMCVSGSTIYVLRRGERASVATEDSVIAFNTTGTSQAGTVTLTQTQLLAAGFANLGDGGATALNNLATDGTNLYVGSAAGSIAKIAITGGTGSILAAAATASGLADASLVYHAAGGSLYVSNFDDDSANAVIDIYRVNATTGAATLFLPEADIEGDADYTAKIGGGEATGQPLCLSIMNDYLYVSLECANSNTDSVVRTALNAPAAVSEWTLYN